MLGATLGWISASPQARGLARTRRLLEQTEPEPTRTERPEVGIVPEPTEHAELLEQPNELEGPRRQVTSRALDVAHAYCRLHSSEAHAQPLQVGAASHLLRNQSEPLVERPRPVPQLPQLEPVVSELRQRVAMGVLEPRGIGSARLDSLQSGLHEPANEIDHRFAAKLLCANVIEQSAQPERRAHRVDEPERHGLTEQPLESGARLEASPRTQPLCCPIDDGRQLLDDGRRIDARKPLCLESGVLGQKRGSDTQRDRGACKSANPVRRLVQLDEEGTVGRQARRTGRIEAVDHARVPACRQELPRHGPARS